MIYAVVILVWAIVGFVVLNAFDNPAAGKQMIRQCNYVFAVILLIVVLPVALLVGAWELVKGI